MTGRKNRYELLYPLGVTPTEEGAEILVQAEGKKAVSYTHLTLPTNSRV